jgi:outer membrane protein insertion porin family
LVTDTVKLFSDKFGTYGYAFARIDPQSQIDREKKQVKLVLAADPGRRAYVRRINVSGNTRTRDEVVRREFRQLESAWYDGEKIKLSRDRVDRLGFFKEVNVDTNEVPGTSDQVDVNLSVVEKPTGSINFGAGYSQSDKLSLSGSYKQENAFGSGSTVGFELNTGRTSKTIGVNVFNPYFTGDGVSRRVDAYYRTTRPLEGQGADYTLKTPGASIQFGVPFSETDTVYFGAGIEQTKIGVTDLSPIIYRDYVRLFGASSVALPLTVGWGRDSRDSALVPNNGRYMRLFGELSPGGDVRYARLTGQYQQFIPLSRKFTLAFNTDLSLGKGLGGRPFPLFKYVTGGGQGSVRGFESGSLGPRYTDPNNANLVLGGTKKFNANVELLFPLPGVGNDRSLRLFGFYDIGNVWGEDEKISFKGLKSAIGFGVNWVSPVGPLRLSFGYPIKAKPEDKVQRVQFQVGTNF